MAETLKIENFGPIKKANLKLGKTTIFIGEQSSGKSTIAKLIAIFRDYTLLDALNPAVNINLSQLLNEKFKNYQLLLYFKKESSFHYENSFFSLSYQSKVFLIKPLGAYYDKIKETKALFEAGDVLNSNDYKAWEQQIRENTKSDSPILRILNASSEIYKIKMFFSYFSREVVKHSYYIPAERILISTLSKSIYAVLGGQITLPKFLIDFAGKYEHARNRQAELDIDVLGIKFSSIDGVDKISDNNIEIDISDASSGIQSLIPLTVAVIGAKRDDHTLPFFETFVIEEPELNLYPSTQLKLINFLAANCTHQGNELVITTHSPYVLTALNNLIFAYKSAAKKPEQKKKITKIIPEASWLNPVEFKAYYVGKGTVKDIISKKTGLIGENHLDDASDEVRNAFYKLMEIYKD